MNPLQSYRLFFQLKSQSKDNNKFNDKELEALRNFLLIKPMSIWEHLRAFDCNFAQVSFFQTTWTSFAFLRASKVFWKLFLQIRRSLGPLALSTELYIKTEVLNDINLHLHFSPQRFCISVKGAISVSSVTLYSNFTTFWTDGDTSKKFHLDFANMISNET